MPRAVLDMADLRPIWAMPDWVPQRIREVLPADWDLYVSSEQRDGSGDGVVRAGPEVLEAVSEAQIYLGWGIPGSIIEAGGDLEWVHTAVAGVGGSLSSAMLESRVVFTNSAGIHAPPMAETVLGMILHFARGLDLAAEGQRRGEWWQDPFVSGDTPLFELADSTVGIVGFGGIGREVARRVAALGARVVASKRTPAREGADDLEAVAGGGRLGDHVDVGHGREGLDRVLRESDVVVLSAPETDETRGMIDADALVRMKDGVILVNVARGKLIDEKALERALRSGRVRGAGLDVFAREPLPEDHPFWSLPNVLVTPHVSAVTDGFWERETALIVENVGRYLAGEPLRNTVDKAAGY